MTKLASILKKRKIRPTDFQKMILEKHNVKFGLCRISKLINGKFTNYTIKTAKILADTLNVTLNDIID